MPRLLLIEDNDDDVELFKLAMKNTGVICTLDVAGDGATAIKYLSDAQASAYEKESRIPDLVLLDLSLPDKSGYAVLCWLRQFKEFATVPVIILTDSDFRQDVLLASSLGANSYVVKTGDIDRLTESVALILHYWLEINLAGKPN
jgi:two-component system, chemotaxis family, response regulator Rcp1